MVLLQDGMTCLMCACQFGWIRVTEELLKRRCHIHRAMMVGTLVMVYKGQLIRDIV